MSELDIGISVALGIGLAAATGFRIFLPLLAMSAAAWTGQLPLGAEFSWLGTSPALAMLSAAALLEILADYIPGVDNLLDALATPAAFVAGTIASAAVMTELPPLVKWTTAVIAGGGAAGLLQSVTTGVRASSTVMTGGLGNFVLATLEWLGALLVALLALAFPLAALAVVVVLLLLGLRMLRGRRRAHASSP